MTPIPGLSHSGVVLIAGLMFWSGGAALAQAPAQPPGQTPTAPAQPQPPTSVDRAAAGPADKDIQVGVYINVRPDCSSGPLPTIRLAQPPAHGNVNVKSGKVNARNYKQCLALEVPAYVAFYRSQPNFAGTDSFQLEVRYQNGRTEMQTIRVNVGGMPVLPGAPKAAPKQQSI